MHSKSAISIFILLHVSVCFNSYLLFSSFHQLFFCCVAKKHNISKEIPKRLLSLAE